MISDGDTPNICLDLGARPTCDPVRLGLHQPPRPAMHQLLVRHPTIFMEVEQAKSESLKSGHVTLGFTQFLAAAVC